MVVVPTAIVAGTPAKIKSGEAIKPPPIPNNPERNPMDNPKVKSKLSTIPKVASTDSQMILSDPWNSLYGYPMAVTSNVPSNLTKGNVSGSLSGTIFGDYSQLILALFSTPDIMIDPYTNAAKGTIRVLVHQEVDCGIRHDKSFAVIKDYLTT